MSQRFLITGAFGCIGAWTVRRLVAEGASVFTYDIGGDSYRLQLIMDEDELAKVTLLTGDITDLEAFEAAVVDNGITHIIHLAALQVPFCRATPVLGAQVNVVGTAVVFEAVKRHMEQIEGLVFVSSFGVYGEAEHYPSGPLAYDAPLLPPTLYGVYKQANEGTAKIFWREHGLHSTGLRPCIVYGPGRDQGNTSTPTKAMLAAALGRQLHINFGGTIIYHHADDVAAVMIAAARKRLEGAPCFNIGGSTISMEEIVATIEDVIPGAAGNITYEKSSLPHPSSIDDSALNSALGPIDYRSFKDGVRDTIDLFMEARDAGRLDVDIALRA